jgi:hypothetical protein
MIPFGPAGASLGSLSAGYDPAMSLEPGQPGRTSKKVSAGIELGDESTQPNTGSLMMKSLCAWIEMTNAPDLYARNM